MLYRFAASLYYANSNRFNEEILELTTNSETPVEWLCVDAGVIFDIDFTGAQTLRGLLSELDARGVRLVVADISMSVCDMLERYGPPAIVSDDALYDRIDDVVDAYGSRPTVE